MQSSAKNKGKAPDLLHAIYDQLQAYNAAEPGLDLSPNTLTLAVPPGFDEHLPAFKGEHKVFLKHEGPAGPNSLTFIGTCVVPPDAKDKLVVTFLDEGKGKLYITVDLLLLVRDKSYALGSKLPPKELCVLVTNVVGVQYLPSWCDWRPWLQATHGGTHSKK